MKLVDGWISTTPIQVGRWHGNLEFKVVPLDDNSLILGQDFLRLSNVIPVLYASPLVFLSNTEAWIMSMKK